MIVGDPRGNAAVIEALRGIPRGIGNTVREAGRMALGTLADPYGAGRTTGQAMQGATRYATETPLPQMGSDIAGAAQGAYQRATSSPGAAGEMVGENVNPLGWAKKAAVLGLLGRKMMPEGGDIPPGGGGGGDVPPWFKKVWEERNKPKGEAWDRKQRELIEELDAWQDDQAELAAIPGPPKLPAATTLTPSIDTRGLSEVQAREVLDEIRGQAMRRQAEAVEPPSPRVQKLREKRAAEPPWEVSYLRDKYKGITDEQIREKLITRSWLRTQPLKKTTGFLRKPKGKKPKPKE